MNQVLRIFLFAFVCFTPSAALAVSKGETAALQGLEAMNRNQGERFINIAHPKLIQKLRDIMTARMEVAANRGVNPIELQNYGVKTVEEFKGLSPESVARMTVNHMSDTEPAKLREMMHTAKFAIANSTLINAETLLVTITIEMSDGNRHQTSSVEVISKLDGGIWKYWGFPELAKGA